MLTNSRPFAIAAAAMAAFALAAPASAQSVASQPELSLSQVEGRLTAQGFRVLEIERDDGRYEVKALNSAGACVELDVHRSSGEVLRTRSDDDCGSGSHHSSNHRSGGDNGGDDRGGRRSR
ncbi:PepSY domain-containing protein [Candidatus Viadribacter manganicus]|uniref:PepSY domain-containing protein n=1 Tax=Candidatus Viadribacter manganicus TaxID=1759059 RepID=A0A1B1AEJ9_9PROT|nr:hypothetical protein ATE48_03090 [Candidatus Viadribacter manganicus]